MNYQIATLVWLLLVIAVVLCAIGTLFSLMGALDKFDLKWLGVGVAGLFVTAIIGWGIWVVYPLTAVAMQ